jgi:hypothetical protein
MINDQLSTPEGIETLRDLFRQTDPATTVQIREALEELKGDGPLSPGDLRQFTGDDFSPSTGSREK